MLVQIDIAWFLTHLIDTKVLGYVPLEGYFGPFRIELSLNLPPTDLYFLKKSGDFPLRPICMQKFFDLKHS